MIIKIGAFTPVVLCLIFICLVHQCFLFRFRHEEWENCITISVVVDEGPVHNDGFGICLDVRKLFISESGPHDAFLYRAMVYSFATSYSRGSLFTSGNLIALLRFLHPFWSYSMNLSYSDEGSATLD